MSDEQDAEESPPPVPRAPVVPARHHLELRRDALDRAIEHHSRQWRRLSIEGGTEHAVIDGPTVIETAQVFEHYLRTGDRIGAPPDAGAMRLG